MAWSRYRQGDENKPIGRIAARCPIIVYVIDLSHNDDVVYKTEIDYSNPADRKWLGRITYWAVSNGHSIETMAKDDANKMEQLK